MKQVEHSLNRIHMLLTVQSLVIILLSINRLSSFTTGYVASNEFLRWVDLNNMLTLPLIGLIAFYLLKRHLEASSSRAYDQDRKHLWLNLAFIIGVYGLGAGYGNHEITNYLHVRFCPEEQVSRLCQIIIFNDDQFSHWLFFLSFVLINASLMFLQVLFPHVGSLTSKDRLILIVNALFIALGIFANLAFEPIGLDLYVIMLLAALALGLLWRYRTQPLLIYYATAYSIGLIATALYKSY